MAVSGQQQQPVQNLSLCIILMSLSGLLRVAATMVLAYPDFIAKKQQQQQGEESHDNNDEECMNISTSNNNNVNGDISPSNGSTRRRQGVVPSDYSTSSSSSSSPSSLLLPWYYIATHVSLLAIAAMISVVGTFYGPVGIAVPVQTGSQLLFNVIAMGYILQMRTFDKAQRTGTYVVFLSVLSLIDVGPGTQNGQNVAKLLSKPFAAAWAILISTGLVWTSSETVRLLVQNKPSSEAGDDNDDGDQEMLRQSLLVENNEAVNDENVNGRPTKNDNYTFLILLAGGTLSNVAMATSGKALGSLSSNGLHLAIAFCYYLVASLLGLLFSVTSSTACDQGLFTPASSVALVVVNFITGIIIWEDWKVLDTWVGYICACLLMCCGVYLLAEIDILARYNYYDVSKIRHQIGELSSSSPASNNEVVNARPARRRF